MPPVLPRKRQRSESPQPKPPPKRSRESTRTRTRTRNPHAPSSTASAFQTLEAPQKVRRTLSQTKAFLDQIDGDDDDELSEPESSEDEFEDVPLNGAITATGKLKSQHDPASKESEEEDWEDALGNLHHHTKPQLGPVPIISGDIALTLSAAPRAACDSRSDGKKGPSKVQRHIRNVTHCMHVQYLMFHNLVRNAWIQDKEVQKILVGGLSSGCWRELERYWRDAGISDGPSRVAATEQKTQPMHEKTTTLEKGSWKDSGKKGVKVYESPTRRRPAREHTGKTGKSTTKDTLKGQRESRDWGAASEPLEPNTPNLSAGDPLLRLFRYFSAYWKAKFTITTPSLRKRGYLSPATLEAEINAWREDPGQADTFGERIESLEAFREVARRSEGSRDVGEQLFTALMRGLGVEARMVASLQPVGFGWSQNEEGKPKNLKSLNKPQDATKLVHSTPTVLASAKGKPKQHAKKKREAPPADSDLSDSSVLSSVISISSDSEVEHINKFPKSRNYSEVLPYPTYWTEVISHLTHTPISVSPFPRPLIASSSSPDKLVEFYARGAAADKSRQILAYLIAFSSDGTAKDVTTRYLPKHQWPGRTKGFRMPIERIPIHNKRGKVKRWEEWDWFKSLMRPYARPHNKRQPWDEIEDEGDLIPAKPEKKKEMDEEGGKETLQGYKNSSEYVLKRHLRREEALKSGAKIIRHFVTGKGNNEKSEPVYRRKDIVNCKTVESWHKEGREVKAGEQPLKFVPTRAVTVNRKREIEERERIEGTKATQGLYSMAQTEWIIPDPIVEGKIPRNAFGNIDIYVPTMIPSGAIHIPLKGTARICRKLKIDHAEACTGFEFGKQRAVPVLTGVVVAAENEDLVIDAWGVEEAEKAKKDADKRQKLVLGLWKKFTSGLRIIERMKAEYGEDGELPDKVAKTESRAQPKQPQSEWDLFQANTNFEGGFLREDNGSANGGFIPGLSPVNNTLDTSGDFFSASQDEPVHGDLTIEHGEQKDDTRTSTMDPAYRTPISLTSALRAGNPAANDEDLDSDENQALDEDEALNILSTRSKSTKAQSSRSLGRGATQSSTSTRKRKSAVVESSDELPVAPSRPATPPPSTSTRSAPKRKAARKSDAQVKSHFFANGSDGETDLGDITDRNSPKKRTASRGKGSGRGRGRPRGRGGGKVGN